MIGLACAFGGSFMAPLMDSDTDGGCAEAKACLGEICGRLLEDWLIPRRIPTEYLVGYVYEVLIDGFSWDLQLKFIFVLLQEPRIAQAVLIYVEDATFRTLDDEVPNFEASVYSEVLYYACLVAQATGDRNIIEFCVRVSRRGLISLETLPDQDWRDEWYWDEVRKFLHRHSSEFHDGRDLESLEGLLSVASELRRLSGLIDPERSVALRQLVERVRGT